MVHSDVTAMEQAAGQTALTLAAMGYGPRAIARPSVGTDFSENGVRTVILHRHRDTMLGKEENWERIRAQLDGDRPAGDALAWRRYAQRLYNAPPDAVLPRISDVDMIYLEGAKAALPRDVVVPPHCPTDEGTPYLGRTVHAPRQAVWFSRNLPLAPASNHTWTEVTHCGGGWNERQGHWMYVVRGSGLFVNTGRTIVFGRHEDAVTHFLNRQCRVDINWCDEHKHCFRECDEELPHVLEAARLANYDSLQFVSHCDMRCAQCGHELVFTGFDGQDACSPYLEYRRGLNASLPCECVATLALATLRGRCAACHRVTRATATKGPMVRSTKGSGRAARPRPGR